MKSVKVSPAFEPFLANSGPEDKQDAVVVYRSPEGAGGSVRGRLRALKTKLDFVKASAAAQQPVELKLFEDYQKAGAKRLKVKQELGAWSIGAMPIAQVEVTRKTLPALAEHPDVVAIMPNQKIRLIKPKDVNYEELAKQENKEGLTWGLKHLDVRELWKTTKGKDINVAVLDTGVYGDHPALAGRVKQFVVVDPLGNRIMTQNGKTFDCGMHGTHVCGTICGGKTADGVSIGVAPEAQVLAAGVLIGDATLVTLLEGISWAVENGADIINMSLGFTYYEPLFTEVFDMLLDQYSVVPVVAIGNENYGNMSSPGSAYNGLSVGALEQMSGKHVEVAAFSSGASLVFPGQTTALVTKPDVVAPGVQVYSCIPPEKRVDGTYDYTYMDGTSMATPHAAGVMALLLAAAPTAKVRDIIEAVKQTAKHPDGAVVRPDNRWGFGLIQPGEAMKAIQS
jgi:subtilisin family serine protease